MDAPDDIPELLRQAHAKDPAATEEMWDECRASWAQAVAWHRKAGRAFASEGLETSALSEQTTLRIARDKAALREALRGLLRRTDATDLS